jgi:phosphoglycolate phosphatase-like HAD superfamily hydrolase
MNDFTEAVAIFDLDKVIYPDRQLDFNAGLAGAIFENLRQHDHENISGLSSIDHPDRLLNLIAGETETPNDVYNFLLELKENSQQSYTDYGYSGQFAIDDYGMERNALTTRAYQLARKIYNIRYDHDMLAPVDDDIQCMFEDLYHDGLHFVILTHATKGWAAEVLEARGLAGYFEEGAILGRDHFGSLHKKKSPDSLRRAVEATGGQFGGTKTIMIDDKAENLVHASNSGMVTIQQKPDLDNANQSSHVDYIVDNLRAALTTIYEWHFDHLPKFVHDKGAHVIQP